MSVVSECVNKDGGGGEMVFLTFGGMISRGMRRACRERRGEKEKFRRKLVPPCAVGTLLIFSTIFFFSQRKSKEEDSVVLQHTFLSERRRRRNGRVSEKLEK